MKTVTIQTAKTHFSSLVEEAAAGSEIIITKAGKRAKLAPLADARGSDQSRERKRAEPAANKSGAFKRTLGALKGLIEMHDNFDDPLPPEIAEAFGIRQARRPVPPKAKLKPSPDPPGR